MTSSVDNISPDAPEIITDGVVEVVSFYDYMDPTEVINELLEGNYVLIEDYYPNGLEVLRKLKQVLKENYSGKTFQRERAYRAAYQKASHNLVLMVENHQLVVDKSPEIGWFEILYPDEELFLMAFPLVQGLNSSWQWYMNGLEIDSLGYKIHPYFGIYFPTRFDHVDLFDDWLKNYKGSMETAIDVGVGSGILSFLLAKHGFSSIIGTDINPNAIIGVIKESTRLKLDEKITAIQGDLFAEIDDKADLVVFNPPWLPAKRDIESGIDRAIYYENDLFERFFAQAKDYLKNDGQLIILFSNLGQIVGKDVRHPMYYEIQNHDRFQKVSILYRDVKAASKKTKRKDYRDNEMVELWVLTHKDS